MVSNQNLVKSKFPYINAFDREGPAVFNTMRDLTSGVFEHLDITSPIDVYQRVAYRQIILRGAALKNYKAVWVECKQSSKYISGDNWDLGAMKEISTEDFCTWSKKDVIRYDGDS